MEQGLFYSLLAEVESYKNKSELAILYVDEFCERNSGSLFKRVLNELYNCLDDILSLYYTQEGIKFIYDYLDGEDELKYTYNVHNINELYELVSSFKNNIIHTPINFPLYDVMYTCVRIERLIKNMGKIGINLELIMPICARFYVDLINEHFKTESFEEIMQYTLELIDVEKISTRALLDFVSKIKEEYN